MAEGGKGGGAVKGCLSLIGGAVVLIVVIVVIAAAVGSKKSGTGTTNSPALVNTVTTPETKTETKTEAPPPEKPQTFKGAGTENLGTINVTAPSTLEWNCAGCLVFSIDGATSDYSATIAVDSSDRSQGVTAVEPGTYKSVDVIADEGERNAGWTIEVRPR
jgi:hypothetical protein